MSAFTGGRVGTGPLVSRQIVPVKFMSEGIKVMRMRDQNLFDIMRINQFFTILM